MRTHIREKYICTHRFLVLLKMKQYCKYFLNSVYLRCQKAVIQFKRNSSDLRLEHCTYRIPGSGDFRLFPKAGAERAGSNIYLVFPLIVRSAKYSTTTMPIMKKVCYGSCFKFRKDSKLKRENNNCKSQL